jgi:hypothetical protein
MSRDHGDVGDFFLISGISVYEQSGFSRSSALPDLRPSEQSAASFCSFRFFSASPRLRGEKFPLIPLHPR